MKRFRMIYLFLLTFLSIIWLVSIIIAQQLPSDQEVNLEKYRKYCSSCHGLKELDLKSGNIMSAIDISELIDEIYNKGKDISEAYLASKGTSLESKIKSMENYMNIYDLPKPTDEEINAIISLLNYLYSLRANANNLTNTSTAKPNAITVTTTSTITKTVTKVFTITKTITIIREGPTRTVTIVPKVAYPASIITPITIIAIVIIASIALLVIRPS